MGTTVSAFKGASPEIEASTPESQPRRGRGDERRQAILDAADEIFLEAGFQAASMAAIAARVGGSKGTLYNYFPSKEDLFLACVSRHCEALRQQMTSLLAEGGDLHETLTRVGRRFAEVISSDRFVRRMRLIIAESERAPALSRAFYETGPARGAEVLAGYFEQQIARGGLQQVDALGAAHQFLVLCTARYWKARLLNVVGEPTKAEIAEDVDRATRMFIAGYGAR